MLKKGNKLHFANWQQPKQAGVRNSTGSNVAELRWRGFFVSGSFVQACFERQ